MSPFFAQRSGVIQKLPFLLFEIQKHRCRGFTNVNALAVVQNCLLQLIVWSTPKTFLNLYQFMAEYLKQILSIQIGQDPQ